MIRPVTLVCFLLACGAGLYLYSAKHRVQLVDHEIEKTVRATDELREQIRVLHAEWTLQNDPQRLQALADQFLSLKTVTPGQFTSWRIWITGCQRFLPPEPTAPEATEPQPVPVAQAPQPEELPPAPAAPRPAAPASPPARPAAVVAVAAPPVPPPAERKPPPPRPVLADAPHEHPVTAEVQQARPSPVVARRVVVAEQPRPAQPPARLPMTGSALGMARSASAPPPRPMPVSATQWVSNGGGG